MKDPRQLDRLYTTVINQQDKFIIMDLLRLFNEGAGFYSFTGMVRAYAGSPNADETQNWFKSFLISQAALDDESWQWLEVIRDGSPYYFNEINLLLKAKHLHSKYLSI